jgi:hypothetical protein
MVITKRGLEKCKFPALSIRRKVMSKELVDAITEMREEDALAITNQMLE